MRMRRRRVITVITIFINKSTVHTMMLMMMMLMFKNEAFAEQPKCLCTATLVLTVGSCPPKVVKKVNKGKK